MAKCEDCQQPVVFLKKPGGGWLPPVDPLFDFAYNDHYTATVDGIAQPVPQVYRRHVCVTWEEKQRLRYEREQEKQRLIEEDRERRAEAQRVQAELEEARRAQEEAEAELEAQFEKERRQQEARAAKRHRKKKAEQRLESLRNWGFPKRLLPYPCRDCGAQEDEPCRTEYWSTRVEPHLWWQEHGHGSRYADAPPDDRSKIHHTERWGPNYEGPWPPAANDPGAYEMRAWLQQNYLYVFEPEKVWLTDAEQSNLSDWLAQHGDVFQEVSDGPGEPEGVADQGGRLAGGSGVRGGDAGRDARREEGGDDRVDHG